MIQRGIVFLFLLVLLACKEDSKSDTKPFFGYQYAPLAVGQFRVYQVDSIAYDDFTGSIDTVRFQQKYHVESEEIASPNGRAFILGEYRRTNDTLSWRKVKALRHVLSDRLYEVQDNNELILALSFPIASGVSWDGNAKNTMNEKRFRYERLHERSSFNGRDYDSTLVVKQFDEFNEIERFLEEESYASQIGLIYQRKLALQTDFGGDIRSGFDRSMHLIQFGLE